MYYRLLILFTIVIFSGCASNPMILSPEQEIQSPLEDEAQVIFLRSSFVGSSINASLYEVTNGDIEFLGVIANDTKLTYKTTQGNHVFMVISEAADFMEADLSAGKNYFSIATPRMGAWKARFSLWPIKNDENAAYHTSMNEFTSWINDTKLVENTDTSISWYENNKESVRKKYEKYWPEWEKKTADDISKRTLLPEDGM